MDSQVAIDTIAALVKDVGEKNEKAITRKELPWDFFYAFIATTILGLTALDFFAEFFVGNSVSCFPPPDTVSVVDTSTEDNIIYGFALRQADYINQFCYQSTTRTRYLPLLFLAQGIAMAIPHSLWAVFLSGDFDSFFTITQKLTLHGRKGHYSKDSISLLGQLEERHRSQRIIYLSYIIKLGFQIIVCTVFIILSAILFNDFTTSFICPDSAVGNSRKLPEDNVPKGWPLNCTVSCIYTSLIFFRVVWITTFILTILAILVTCLGFLLLCIPKPILGSKKRVEFLLKHNISERFQFKTKGWISDDLDFLLYLLSGIDPIKAQRFKDIQVCHRITYVV